MPRMKAETLNFGLRISPIESALININNSITTGGTSSLSALDEIFTQLRMTHLGHETHLWDAEVREVD